MWTQAMRKAVLSPRAAVLPLRAAVLPLRVAVLSLRVAGPSRRATMWSFAVAPIVVFVVAGVLTNVRVPHINFFSKVTSEIQHSPEKGIYRYRCFSQSSLGVYRVFSQIAHSSQYWGDLVEETEFPSWADPPFEGMSEQAAGGMQRWGLGFPCVSFTYRESLLGFGAGKGGVRYVMEGGSHRRCYLTRRASAPNVAISPCLERLRAQRPVLGSGHHRRELDGAGLARASKVNQGAVSAVRVSDAEPRNASGDCAGVSGESILKSLS